MLESLANDKHIGSIRKLLKNEVLWIWSQVKNVEKNDLSQAAFQNPQSDKEVSGQQQKEGHHRQNKERQGSSTKPFYFQEKDEIK
jgi:hypothetical protein